MKKLAFLTVLGLFLFSACQKDSNGPGTIDFNDNNSEFSLGWTGDEDASDVPNAIHTPFSTENLPEKYSLLDYAPPIGDQGTKGTCVAWAIGYNLKTMIAAIENQTQGNALADPAVQTSPTDLFLAIPSSERGANCEGTYLKSALEVLQNRGAATMDVAPYSDQSIGDCSQGPDPNAAAQAEKNTIAYYRQINIDVNEFKSHIANNRPIGFGARLADNFMNWNSDDVLTQHTTFNQVGQHAGHAMAIVGYDDSKGPNGAFQVVNSWDDIWGDDGKIWIDYQFMTGGEFADIAYIAENSEGQFDPDDPNPAPNVNIDLASVVFSESGDGRDRELIYDLYNIGTQTASASLDWSAAYVFINAFDVNDYHVVLWDYYSDDHGSPGDFGTLDEGYGDYNYFNHADLPSGSSSAQQLIGENAWSLNYQIPELTGYYYAVLIADLDNSAGDQNAANNLYILSDEYGAPIYLEGGVPQGLWETGAGSQTESTRIEAAEAHKMLSHNIAPNERSDQFRNAYRKPEIKKHLLGELKSGHLYSKATKSGNMKK